MIETGPRPPRSRFRELVVDVLDDQELEQLGDIGARLVASLQAQAVSST